MGNDRTLTITVIVVFIAAIVIILYLLFFRKEEDIPPPIINGDVPEPPPGYEPLKFDKTVSYKDEIKWNLDREYYATLLYGNFRVGGAFKTTVTIYVRSGGNWKKLGEVAGSPNKFTQFEFAPSMRIDGVKWRVEWLFIPHYIDEVHAQLMVEV